MPRNSIRSLAGQMHREHKRRALKLRTAYNCTAADLEAILTRGLKVGLCFYCAQPVTLQNITLDHRTPTSRGGLFHPDNIIWCCGDCNLRKAEILASEFQGLSQLVRQWSPQSQRSLWVRLALGGRTKGGRG